MTIDVKALKDEFAGHRFDEVHFDIDAESLVAFAESCGETEPRFTDPDAPDFRAAPSYPTRFHGSRQLPDGFPIETRKSFDAGKSVEVHGSIRPGDRITARSQIHDIYEKSGRSGLMVFVVHRMEFFNQDEQLVAIVDWRLVQREDAV